jgi:Domain of unknown function (DUF4136)
MIALARRVFFLRCVAALSVLSWLSVDVGTAKVRVRAHRDETFDFRGLRTWAWHPTGAGDVRMALTADDNPAAVKDRYGPTILQAVEQELARRQLTLAGNTEPPDLYVNYYLLISTNMSAQTLGQFAPSVPEWGLPLFSGATQSLRVIEQGSLVLDVTSSASKTLVWRGVAQAEIHRERADAERLSRIRDAIKQVIGKFPKT